MMKKLLQEPLRLTIVLLRRWQTWAVLVLLGTAAWIGLRLGRGEGPALTVTTDKTIQLTPQQVRSIKDIGEWEFLAVSTEEMVDTLRKGFLTDDRLVRIYTGMLRLGVNLKEAPEGWIVAHGDTVDVTLPPVRLLDRRFIDEARTRSFYEKGTWSGEAKEQMYRKAQRAMLRRGLTRANLQQAEENARGQFEALFRSLGFGTVNLTFTQSHETLWTF